MPQGPREADLRHDAAAGPVPHEGGPARLRGVPPRGQVRRQEGADDGARAPAAVPGRGAEDHQGRAEPQEAAEAARRGARDRGPRAAALHECPGGRPRGPGAGPRARVLPRGERRLQAGRGEGRPRAAPGRDRAARRRGGAHRRLRGKRGARGQKAAQQPRSDAQRVERPRGRARGRRRGRHGGPPGRGRGGQTRRQAARGPVLLSAAAGARQGPVSHPQEEVRARLQRVHGERCPGVLRVAGLARVRAFVAVLVQPVARHVRERRPALRAVLLDVRFDLPRALHDVLRPGQSGEPRGPAGAEGPEGLGGARARGGHDGALRRRRRPIHALHAQG